MSTTDPLARFGTKQTHQRQQAPDRPEQVKNNAGGFVFEIDKVSQFKRFLTMGTVGGTYYVGQDELSQECFELVMDLTRDESLQIRATDILVEISLAGRAPKQNPTLFALAVFCQHGTTAAKQYARKQITKVVRTGTHLFIFVGYLKQFGGWSRGLRKAVGAWYTEKDADQLAYQLVKYRQREGYTHRDVLRMTHPKISAAEPNGRLVAYESLLPNAESSAHRARVEEGIELAKAERDAILGKRAAIEWATTGGPGKERIELMPLMIRAYTLAQIDDTYIPGVLEQAKLPWEALPDSAMNDTKVWDKLLDNGVPLGALLRQLPRLTKLGMLPAMGGRTDEIVRMLTDPEALRKARIHPINVLMAMKTYSRGYSERGSSVWSPSTKIIDGLDAMFYACFEFVEPTGKRTLQACDISGSMHHGGNGILTPAEIAGAMAMVTAKVEPNHLIMGFKSKSGHSTREPRDSKLVDLNISPRQRMDDVLRRMYEGTFGGTDCALPMLTAIDNEWEIDTFVIYTDNETWHGDIHPFQAMKTYRRVSGIDAKLIVVAATATKFTVADPSDPGMLDISGFDSAVPTLISEFSAGRI